MNNHKHHHCAHPSLKYCSHCNVVYCVDCDKEWYEQAIQYVYTHNPYVVTGTPFYKQPEITWTCSSADSTSGVSNSGGTNGTRKHAHAD